MEWSCNYATTLITVTEITVQQFQTPIHMPYIIECLSADEVDSTLQQPHIFPSFPVHTQSVERAVKLVSEASLIVEGAERRHGQILSVMEARMIWLAFENMKDYKVIM